MTKQSARGCSQLQRCSPLHLRKRSVSGLNLGSVQGPPPARCHHPLLPRTLNPSSPSAPKISKLSIQRTVQRTASHHRYCLSIGLFSCTRLHCPSAALASTHTSVREISISRSSLMDNSLGGLLLIWHVSATSVSSLETDRDNGHLVQQLRICGSNPVPPVHCTTLHASVHPAV